MPGGKVNISCGIGIDYGRMLVTKTGVRRHGNEQQNYRSLVWLGRPANIASKLTDLANKTTHYSRIVISEMTVAPKPLAGPLASILGSSPAGPLASILGGSQFPASNNPFVNALQPAMDHHWSDVDVETFFDRLKPSYLDATLTHSNPAFRAARPEKKTWSVTTQPILMTQLVYDGFRQASPAEDKPGWWTPQSVSVPGYIGKVYGGDVIYPTFKSDRENRSAG
jgi:hypothetical protein